MRRRTNMLITETKLNNLVSSAMFIKKSNIIEVGDKVNVFINGKIK